MLTTSQQTIKANFAAQNHVDEEIAAEIQRHKERIKALKIRRNTYCAVNQLPKDVFTQILFFVKLQAEASCPLGPFSSRPYSEWTVLLRVCHGWHDHVMKSPRFWSTIDLSSPLASTMLARSKAAPLQIKFDIPPDAGESIWSFATNVLSQAHRLQELSTRFPDLNVLSRALASIPPTGSAPQLQRLDIVVATDVGDTSIHLWSDMPSLRSLTLTGGPLPLNTRSMLHLTHLSVGGRHDHGRRVTISWLLRTLQGLPHIQDLDISYLYGPSVEHTFPKVSLPSLRTLQIVSNDPSTLCILDNLLIPSSSKIGIYYEGVGVNDLRIADLSCLHHTLSQIFSSTTTVNAVRISFNGTFELAVYFPGDLYDPSEVGSPSVYCSFPKVPQQDMHILLDICELVPLNKTPLLALRGLTARSISKARVPFIPSAPNIKTLILDNCHVLILQSLMKPRDADYPYNPMLECIHFVDTDFHNAKGGKNGMFINLGNVLRERKRMMIPIGTVVMDCCDINQWARMDLEKYVKVVSKW